MRDTLEQQLNVMYTKRPTNPTNSTADPSHTNNNYHLTIQPIPTDLLTANDLPDTPTSLDSQFATCFDETLSSDRLPRNSPPIGRTTVATSSPPTLAYSNTLHPESSSSILCERSSLGVQQEVSAICTDSGFSSWTTTGYTRPQFSPALISSSSDVGAFLSPSTTKPTQDPSNQSQDLFISTSPPILSNLSCTNALNEELSDTMFIGTMGDVLFRPTSRQSCWSAGHEECPVPSSANVMFCPLEPPDEHALPSSTNHMIPPRISPDKATLPAPLIRTPDLSTQTPIKQPLARHANQSPGACCLFPSPSSAFRRRVSIQASPSNGSHTHWYRIASHPTNITLLRPSHFSSRPSSAPLNYHSCIQEEDDPYSNESDCWLADQPEVDNDGDIESDSSPTTQPIGSNLVNPCSNSLSVPQFRSSYHSRRPNRGPRHPRHTLHHFPIRPWIFSRSPRQQVDFYTNTNTNNRQSPYLGHITDDSYLTHENRCPSGSEVQRMLGPTPCYGDVLMQPRELPSYRCFGRNSSPGQTPRRPTHLASSPLQARPIPDVVPQIPQTQRLRLDYSLATTTSTTNFPNTPRCSSVPLTLSDIEQAMTLANPQFVMGTSASIHDSSSTSQTSQGRLSLLARRMAFIADELDASQTHRRARHSLPNDSFLGRMRAASSLWRISSSLVSLVTSPLDYVQRFMELANLSLSSTPDTQSSSAIVVRTNQRRRADTYTCAPRPSSMTSQMPQPITTTTRMMNPSTQARHSLNLTYPDSSRRLSLEFAPSSLPNPMGRPLDAYWMPAHCSVQLRHTSTPYRRSRVHSVTYCHPPYPYAGSPSALTTTTMTEPCHSAMPTDPTLFSFDSN